MTHSNASVRNSQTEKLITEIVKFNKSLIKETFSQHQDR